MFLFDGDVFRKQPKDKWDMCNYVLYEVFYHDDYHQEPHIRLRFVGAVCGGHTPEIEELYNMQKLGNVYSGFELPWRT